MNENNGLPESEQKTKVNIFKGRLGRIVTAGILLAVLLLNIGVGALFYGRAWYIDTSSSAYEDMYGIYTFSDELEKLMESQVLPDVDRINSERTAAGEDELKIKIIFCTDADYIEKNDNSRMIQYTARNLCARFSDYFEIEYINIDKNPTAIQQYRVTSSTRIYSSDVIITFGTEYLVNSAEAFFTLDNDTGEVWAYNGEKQFASAILSLTRADSPVCALTYNHGEILFDMSSGSPTVKEKYSAFIDVIEGAGYEVIFIDLEREEIPKDCRMIICFAPTRDFYAYGSLGELGVSEIEKLDRYLDAAHSFFYVCDRDTPKLPALEEYLYEWGIAPYRVKNQANQEVLGALTDPEACIDSLGHKVTGMYATVGLGSSVTSSLRAQSYPPRVIFEDATVIKHSAAYGASYNLEYDFYTYTYLKNGVYRTMTDIFSSCESAAVQIDGKNYEHAHANNLFSLFTVTAEDRQIQQDSFSSVNDASYVLALASTSFFENEYLESAAYGNADVLLSAFRKTGGEIVPVNIQAYRPLYVYETTFVTTYKTNYPATVICFAAIPIVAAAVVGLVIGIKRKHR